MVGKTDINAMLSDYDEDREARGGGVFYRPPVGESLIRLLPAREDASGRAIVKGGTHWVGGRSVACPVACRLGESCFLCDRADELFRSGDAADRAEARELSVRIRFYANVYNPRDPSMGIKVWEFGRQVYDQLMRYMADPDYGDVTDLDTGYDFVVERVGERLKTRHFIRARKSPSPVIQEIRDLLDQNPDALHNLRGLWPAVSNDEMRELYEGISDEEIEPVAEDDDMPTSQLAFQEAATPTRSAGQPVEPAHESQSTQRGAPMRGPDVGQPPDVAARPARSAQSVIDEVLARRRYGRR